MNPLGLSWQERREVEALLTRHASGQVSDGDRCAEIYVGVLLALVALFGIFVLWGEL